MGEWNNTLTTAQHGFGNLLTDATDEMIAKYKQDAVQLGIGALIIHAFAFSILTYMIFSNRCPKCGG